MSKAGPPPGLTSFFTDVDDAKYEKLLDDLREHDLLGPMTSSGAMFLDNIHFGTKRVDGMPAMHANNEWANDDTNMEEDTNEEEKDSDFDMNGLADQLGLDDDEEEEEEEKEEAEEEKVVKTKPRKAWMTKEEMEESGFLDKINWPEISIVPQRNTKKNRERNVEMKPKAAGGKWMTAGDLKFIVAQQMKQVRSSDPFSDDYYFHNFTQKRIREQNRSAVPLPTMNLQHTKAEDMVDMSRSNKSRGWEAKFNVLGRQEKSSLYRPRQMLNLSSPNESDEEGASKELIFSSSTWNKRLFIGDGFECLLALQDARHILDARGINPQDFHSQDSSTMDPDLLALREKTSGLLRQLADVFGILPTTDTDSKIQCNTDRLHFILSALKGRRLASRAIPLLHPNARNAILPHIVKYVIRLETSASEEGTTSLELLAQTVVVTIMYHPPLPPPQVLASALEAALSGHTVATLSEVLQNRSKAEVLQALLQKGGSDCIAAGVDAEVTAKWNKWQNEFVQLASAMQQS